MHARLLRRNPFFFEFLGFWTLFMGRLVNWSSARERCVRRPSLSAFWAKASNWMEYGCACNVLWVSNLISWFQSSLFNLVFVLEFSLLNMCFNAHTLWFILLDSDLRLSFLKIEIYEWLLEVNLEILWGIGWWILEYCCEWVVDEKRRSCRLIFV